MTARFRLILPTIEMLAVAAFCFLAIQGCRMYAEWAGAAPLPPGHSLLRMGETYLRGIALAYGAFRVVALHPFYQPGYRAWLALTPWTSRKPLPLGPVALVWEDLFVLAALMLLGLTVPGVDPWRLLALFFVAYLGALTVSLWGTGEPAYGYLIAFGVGLVLRGYANSLTMVAAALVVYAAGYVGLRRALARFPWGLAGQEAFSLKNVDQYLQSKRDQLCGWPYDRMRPLPPQAFRLDLLNVLLVSMLVGWWLFALEAALEPPLGMLIPAGVLVQGTWIAALVRLGVYTSGYASPMNLWGRLWTGRWIIPGYDKVFVGPLCTLLVSPVSAWALHRLGVPLDVLLPVCCTLMIFTVLAMPPRFRRWQLTGRHRIVPAITNRKEFIQVG